MTVALTIERAEVHPGDGDRRLECRLTHPACGWPMFTAVLAGPHPYMGGDIDNNVVRQVMTAVAEAGGLGVAFNYSGVGASTGPALDVAAALDRFWVTGQAPQDQRLAEDTRAVIAYAERALPAPLFAAGYSFGCWTVVSSLGHFALRGVILISPTIGRHDFEGLKPGAPPTCVISSDNDFLTAENVMRAWVAHHPSVRRHHCLPASEHFFRGQERLVAAHCADFIKELRA